MSQHLRRYVIDHAFVPHDEGQPLDVHLRVEVRPDRIQDVELVEDQAIRLLGLPELEIIAVAEKRRLALLDFADVQFLDHFNILRDFLLAARSRGCAMTRGYGREQQNTQLEDDNGTEQVPHGDSEKIQEVVHG